MGPLLDIQEFSPKIEFMRDSLPDFLGGLVLSKKHKELKFLPYQEMVLKR